MNNFKAGDPVKRVDGHTFSNAEMVVTVGGVTESGRVWFEETGTNMSQEHLLLANEYPNPPHKHRDLIIAWANGAEIQVYADNRWRDTIRPAWDSMCEYRIKPTKTKQQLEIESIENEMRKLADRLNKIKGE